MASVNVRVVTGVLDDSEKQRLIDGVTERARSGLLVPVYVHENDVRSRGIRSSTPTSERAATTS